LTLVHLCLERLGHLDVLRPDRDAMIMWNRMRAPNPQQMQSSSERLKMFVSRRRAKPSALLAVMSSSSTPGLPIRIRSPVARTARPATRSPFTYVPHVLKSSMTASPADSKRRQ